MQEIADYFDVSVDYLLGREEKETPKHVDLSENDTVFSFDGKEISKETMRKAIAIAKALEEMNSWSDGLYVFEIERNVERIQFESSLHGNERAWLLLSEA